MLHRQTMAPENLHTKYLNVSEKINQIDLMEGDLKCFTQWKIGQENYLA